MAPSNDQVSAIKAWLKGIVPNAVEVRSSYEPGSEVQVFRAKVKRPAVPRELAISEAAFEDYSVEQILESLENASVMFAQMPGKRLFLKEDGGDLVLGWWG